MDLSHLFRMNKRTRESTPPRSSAVMEIPRAPKKQPEVLSYSKRVFRIMFYLRTRNYDDALKFIEEIDDELNFICDDGYLYPNGKVASLSGINYPLLFGGSLSTILDIAITSCHKKRVLQWLIDHGAVQINRIILPSKHSIYKTRTRANIDSMVQC